jgi:hypothetical protein
MSISEKIYQVADSYYTIPDKLNAIAELLENEYGLRVNFCRIFGKRWSYVAGDRQLEFAPVRKQLSPRYGIFYIQSIQLTDSELANILQALTHYFTEIDHD